MDTDRSTKRRLLFKCLGRGAVVMIAALVVIAIVSAGGSLAAFIDYRVHNHANDPKYAPYFALLSAVDRGDVAGVKAELDKGTDPNNFPPCDEYEEDLAPLCEAAGTGNLAVVRLLLDRGADPNVEDGWNYNPLTAAAIHSHTEVMDLLIRRGAHVVEDGWSIALWRAAVEGQSKAVTFLISKGANPNERQDGGGSLRQAVIDLGHPEIAPLLLKTGGSKR